MNKDRYIHIRINLKTKMELKEIADKLNTTVSAILEKCIQKTIEKNYKLLEN